MAATYTKPSDIPRWADSTTNISEPSESKKDSGAVLNNPANSSHVNWTLHTTGEWIKWLDERFFDGYTGVKEDFLIRQPGQASAYILFFDMSEAATFLGTSLKPSENTLDLGDDTNDFRNIYTRNLFVENHPVCEYISAGVSYGASTETTVTPANTDTTIASAGLSCNSSRELVLAAGQPSGLYKVDYNMIITHPNAGKDLDIRVYRDAGSGYNLLTNHTLQAHIINAATKEPFSFSWLIGIDAGDKIQIRINNADTSGGTVTAYSHLVANLVNPTYA